MDNTCNLHPPRNRKQARAFKCSAMEDAESLQASSSMLVFVGVFPVHEAIGHMRSAGNQACQTRCGCCLPAGYPHRIHTVVQEQKKWGPRHQGKLSQLPPGNLKACNKHKAAFQGHFMSFTNPTDIRISALHCESGRGFAKVAWWLLVAYRDQEKTGESIGVP